MGANKMSVRIRIAQPFVASLILASGLSLAAATSTEVKATELGGFPPLKFGMSKDEAWEVTGKDGKWDNPDLLVYEMKSEDGDDSVKYFLSFDDDGLAHINMLYEPPIVFTDICRRRGRELAKNVEKMTGVSPLARQGSRTKIWSVTSYPTIGFTLSDVYVFTFERAARVELTVEGESLRSCRIDTWYHPPIKDPIPF